jgi:hypothetical protein
MKFLFILPFIINASAVTDKVIEAFSSYPQVKAIEIRLQDELKAILHVKSLTYIAVCAKLIKDKEVSVPIDNFRIDGNLSKISVFYSTSF